MTGEPRIVELAVQAGDAGLRLDKLLAEEGSISSRSAAQRLIDAGLVQVNGVVAAKNRVVRAGDDVLVQIPHDDVPDLIPEPMDLDVRFEDEHLLVLCKPAGLVVHPAEGHWTGTLVHGLLAHSDDLGSLAGEDRPGIVHRLDKDTSGLMMVAKDDITQAALSDAIKVRDVDRRYAALVHGHIAPDSGIVDAPLGRHPKDRMRIAVSDSPSARQAVTTFRVLERFEPGRADEGYTLIECKLYTGRTHQIRVHMTYIRHAVVGDQLYGRRQQRADLGLGRQFLHAYRLAFTHPITGEPIGLVAPLPAELREALESLADRSLGATDEGVGVIEELLGTLGQA